SACPTSHTSAARLLPVVLDDVSAPPLRLVRVEAGLAPGAPLPQEVPAAIERDRDLLEPRVVAGLQVAMALALVQLLFLCDKLVDPAQDFAVVHGRLLVGIPWAW